jgi:DNA processing protein
LPELIRKGSGQNRAVFAVPGSPLDPRAAGSNDLLRDGANLCVGAQDVIDLLAPLAARGATRHDLLFEPDPVPSAETLWDEMEGLEPLANNVPAFAPMVYPDEDERRAEVDAQAPPRPSIEALLRRPSSSTTSRARAAAR